MLYCYMFIYDGISSLKQGSLSSKHKYFEACFPWRDVLYWFDYKEMGPSILFRMPSTSIGQNRAMIVCVIYCVNEGHNRSICDSLTTSFRNKTKGYVTFDRLDDNRIFDKNICQDHIWLSYMSCLIFEEMTVDEGDEIEVSIEAQGRILVKKCGIHLPIDSYFSNEELGE